MSACATAVSLFAIMLSCTLKPEKTCAILIEVFLVIRQSLKSSDSLLRILDWGFGEIVPRGLIADGPVRYETPQINDGRFVGPGGTCVISDKSCSLYRTIAVVPACIKLCQAGHWNHVGLELRRCQSGGNPSGVLNSRLTFEVSIVVSFLVAAQ